MTDMRQCDICKEVHTLSAQWYFVTDGRTAPSDFRLPEHWCKWCMEVALEAVKELKPSVKELKP